MPRHYSTGGRAAQWDSATNFSGCCPDLCNDLRKSRYRQRQKKDFRMQASGSPGGGWWIRTTEGVASRFTVCPLWPLGKSPIYEVWSWWTDSNPRPADYKSAALPAELHQRLTSEDYITRLRPICQQKFSPPAGIFYINRHRHHIHPCTQERGGS